MTPLYEPPAIETHIYRDRDGYLWIRAKWTGANGLQVEVEEGGVSVDAVEFTRQTIEPLLRRTLVGRI